MELQRRWFDDGLAVAMVTSGETEAARDFAVANGLNFPVLADAGADAEAWRVDFIWGSVIYLVDPSGAVVERELEPVRERLEQELGPGLAPAPDGDDVLYRTGF